MKRLKLQLPKASRGWHFSRVFVVEMNDFEVDRLLPSLFYLIVTRGRKRGPRKNDATALDRYLSAVVQHERVHGFQSEVGRRLMDRWLRAAVIHTGRKGERRLQEQIDYVQPNTLLCYKPGLPAEIRRQRNVHVFLYALLTDVLGEGDRSKGAAHLASLVRSIFGNGLRDISPPSYDSTYDGASTVDIHTLLTLCYLDAFELSTPGEPEDFSHSDPALPTAAGRIAEDILQYLLSYQGRLSAQAITRGLMALINFELFIYTVKLVHAVNELVTTRRLPSEMLPTDKGNGADCKAWPEIYVDFTRQRGSPSDQLARACVDRDLAEIRRFVDSVFYLRTIDRLIQLIPELRKNPGNTPQYLEYLCKLDDHADVVASARAEMRAMRSEALETSHSDSEKEDIEKFFLEVSKHSNAVRALVTILSTAQSQKPLGAVVSWYWSTGGLRKAFGILSGNLKGRRNWRYAVSDELLATLVHVAMTERPNVGWNGVRPRTALRLSEFLNFLYTSYGILVDRPPQFLDSVTARAAAMQNLEALKRRLRQMGFFQALSDDFNAQYLDVPVCRR